MSVFVTEEPKLSNQYLDDQWLQNYLSEKIPAELRPEIVRDLTQFGERVIGDIYEMGKKAEKEEPKLVEQDGILNIEISTAWYALHGVSAEEGLIAIGQEKRFGEYARIYQFAKKYLFNSSSAYFSCPLAMTDGALKVLLQQMEKSLSQNETELYGQAIEHLLAKNPNKFWTSGQWMTEKSGGSDVSNTETVARFENGRWHLHGIKWFTSAVDSQMSLALAKPEGSDQLQLFLVKVRDDFGSLNNIKIIGLKNKLGTKALPTAELELCGTPAIPIGKPGEGVKLISTQFNVTRIHNALECVSSMRRQLALLKDYAGKRTAFGKRLCDLPLFQATFNQLESTFKDCFRLTFFAVELLGKSEQGSTKEIQQLAEKKLRMLTPLLKLYTAKENIKLSSEVIESFGGVGYLEDSGIPKFLRDAQVLSIWEGTTNVLSLDFLRALKKEGPEVLGELVDPDFLKKFKEKISAMDPLTLERCAREISLEVVGQVLTRIAKTK